jgi:hypothetical protein
MCHVIRCVVLRHRCKCLLQYYSCLTVRSLLYNILLFSVFMFCYICTVANGNRAIARPVCQFMRCNLHCLDALCSRCILPCACICSMGGLLVSTRNFRSCSYSINIVGYYLRGGSRQTSFVNRRIALRCMHVQHVALTVTRPKPIVGAFAVDGVYFGPGRRVVSERHCAAECNRVIGDV